LVVSELLETVQRSLRIPYYASKTANSFSSKAVKDGRSNLPKNARFQRAASSKSSEYSEDKREREFVVWLKSISSNAFKGMLHFSARLSAQSLVEIFLQKPLALQFD